MSNTIIYGACSTIRPVVTKRTIETIYYANPPEENVPRFRNRYSTTLSPADNYQLPTDLFNDYPSAPPQVEDDYQIPNFQELTRTRPTHAHFSLFRAAKNFISGCLSPIKAFFKHPLAFIGTVAAGIALATVLPISIPILVGVGLVTSLFQMRKGIHNAVKHYQAGDYRGAENAFEDIGAGAAGTALSITGVRSSVGIIAESKAAALATRNGASTAESIEAGLQAAQKAKSLTIAESLKEHVRLLTTSEGRLALRDNFKLETLGRNSRQGVIKLRQIRESIAKFIERKNMTDAVLESTVSSGFTRTFDEMNIPVEFRPTVRVTNKGEMPFFMGGGYNSATHEILINPKAVRYGLIDLDDVTVHEAKHAQEALLRDRLSTADTENALDARIIDGVLNGESNPIMAEHGYRFIQTPTMSSAMRQHVSKLLKTYLADTEDMVSINSPFFKDSLTSLQMQKSTAFNKNIEALVDTHPEFLAQFKGDRTRAIENLKQYFTAQLTRAHIFKTKITPGLSSDLLSRLQNQPWGIGEKQAARQSVQDIVMTLEGNCRVQGGVPFPPSLETLRNAQRHYLFSPEEILARNTSTARQLRVIENEINILPANPTDNVQLLRLRDLLQQKVQLKASFETNALGKQLMDLQRQHQLDPTNRTLLAQKRAVMELLKLKIKGMTFNQLPVIREQPQFRYNWGLIPSNESLETKDD